MKKITWKLTTCLMAALLLCMPILTGCDKPEDEPETTLDEVVAETTEEATEAMTEVTTEETTKPEDMIEASKGLAFVSNGDGTCFVSGIGECTDTDVVIPSVSPAGDRVVRIGHNAFQGNQEITSVIIPRGVTEIGHAFDFCLRLTSVTLPDGLLWIDAYAFNDCEALININIPDSVTTIGNDAFTDCRNLSVQNEGGVHYIDHWVVGCDPNVTTVTLRSDTVGIYYRSFADCSQLTSITIPDSVVSVGINAFTDCKKLIQVENGIHYVDRWVVDCDTTIKTAVLRSDTVGIGDLAINECANLESIIIPDSVKYIGQGGVIRCPKLTNIVIPAGVKKIESYSFTDCPALASITVQKGNSVYHSEGNCLIETESKTLLTGCKSSVIPTDDSVNRIGIAAFMGCEGLTSIDLPANVRCIAEGAFMRCGNLSSIILPDGIMCINDLTFFACTSLTSMTIPAGMTFIGSSAVAFCENLTDITYSGNKAQWEALNTKDSLQNEALTSATIHCTDGDITPEQ